MPEDPQQPERPDAPSAEDEAREGVPGEPGEATPSETPPEGPEDITPGPEIEGVDELADAAEPEAGPGEERVSGAATPGSGDEGEGAGEKPAAVPEAAEPAGPEPSAEIEEPRPAGGEERPRPGRRRRRDDEPAEEVIPGAHLEPDLVLEEQAASEEAEYAEYGAYAEAEVEAAAEEPEVVEEAPPEPAPVVHQPLDLAADARYYATGKRKSAVARVTLRPGEGTYRVNGRHLDEYFPRVLLQRMARQPLEAAGYHTRMDVVARIHGGGVSAQAGALRHGVARALVEADPALRGELKRRGYLTRDPRVKERKKAGLKKARKRPQFSKR
jgi:small subunit ribosomal protein S9